MTSEPTRWDNSATPQHRGSLGTVMAARRALWTYFQIRRWWGWPAPVVRSEGPLQPRIQVEGRWPARLET